MSSEKAFNFSKKLWIIFSLLRATEALGPRFIRLSIHFSKNFSNSRQVIDFGLWSIIFRASNLIWIHWKKVHFDWWNNCANLWLGGFECLKIKISHNPIIFPIDNAIYYSDDTNMKKIRTMEFGKRPIFGHLQLRFHPTVVVTMPRPRSP